MELRVEKKGRRYYFRGTPIEARGLLLGQGAHWDSHERAWWVGDLLKSRDIEDRLNRVYGPLAVPQSDAHRAAAIIDFDRPYIIGRVLYRNHYYFLVEGPTEERAFLLFNDGSAMIAVSPKEIQIKQRYMRPFSYNEIQTQMQL